MKKFQSHEEILISINELQRLGWTNKEICNSLMEPICDLICKFKKYSRKEQEFILSNVIVYDCWVTGLLSSQKRHTWGSLLPSYLSDDSCYMLAPTDYYKNGILVYYISGNHLFGPRISYIVSKSGMFKLKNSCWWLAEQHINKYVIKNLDVISNSIASGNVAKNYKEYLENKGFEDLLAEKLSDKIVEDISPFIVENHFINFPTGEVKGSLDVSGNSEQNPTGTLVMRMHNNELKEFKITGLTTTRTNFKK